MTKIFQRMSSSQASSSVAYTARTVADIDLAGIVGGAEQGELRIDFGISFGISARVPFSSGLQQLPVGATDADSVPWAELKPAVKKLAAADSIGPSA